MDNGIEREVYFVTKAFEIHVYELEKFMRMSNMKEGHLVYRPFCTKIELPNFSYCDLLEVPGS